MVDVGDRDELAGASWCPVVRAGGGHDPAIGVAPGLLAGAGDPAQPAVVLQGSMLSEVIGPWPGDD